MKIKTILAGLGFLLTTGLINAQSELHIPKEIQKAYKNDTRSKDGKPGIKYWQNSVDYDIEIVVTPETRKIDGKETIVFMNNSPDELSTVVIRLYYDVFKKGNQRDMAVNDEDIGEGVNIKELRVNGEKYDLANGDMVQRYGANLIITLAEPLKSGSRVNLGFQWEQKVPLTVQRAGAIDSTSFFVAYWYPQVAVYDDIFGWDRISYTLGNDEFYNNLANFDVNITAPDNFLVWATGTLENSSAVLPSNIHERYSRAKASTDLVKVVTNEDLTNLKLKSNTWNYKAVEVSDFAFAMSDHFLWDALSQEVSGKDVLISTAYPMAKEEDFAKVTLLQQKTMKHFSDDIPGVPYPYPAFTTFIGSTGGAMEFPMMANNDGPGTGVTIHEMFHTYFPMYVRTNERRFAWMDEGWADFITALVMHNYFSEKDNTASLYSSFKLGMQSTIGTIGVFSLDNKSLYYATDEKSNFVYLAKRDLETGEVTKVYETNWDVWYAYDSWNEKYRVIGINEDAKTKVMILDQGTGKEVDLPEIPGGSISSVNISKSEKLARLTVGTSASPSNIYIYNFETKELKKLTNTLNPEINEEDLVEGQVVRFPSFDGLTIPAIYYQPKQASKDRPVPALVWVHGGPGGQSRLNYFALTQYLVNQGYAILAVNNRGSSGYGKEFNHRDDKNHGKKDLQDCVASKEFLASKEVIDMDKVGIIGGSYGGYMVMAALTFEPEAFDVGVNIFGVTNWIRTLKSIPPYWESFRKALYDELGDPTTLDSVRLRKISPLFHTKNVTKPLMVLQGANDVRVLQVESDEIVEGVKANGVPVEYIVFDDEGHGFQKKENEIEGYGKIKIFLDRYLKGETK